jgi:hypothetical protein
LEAYISVIIGLAKITPLLKSRPTLLCDTELWS